MNPALLLILGSFVAGPLAAQTTRQRAAWPVRDAVLRVEARVTVAPADPALGVYLQIPDGGILPRYPVAEVRDVAGRPLESMLLWHTPADALGLVFAPPAEGGNVEVYIRSAASQPTRPRDTSLRPSLFAFTRPGRASLDDARAMPREWPPARGAYGGPVARIGVRWNPYGSDDNFSSWFTGWFNLKESGTWYFATISDEGSEVHIDGRLLVAWPGRHTRAAGASGQFGKAISLTAGWHRIDYYHFEIDGDQEMCLVWKKGSDAGDPLPVFMEGDAWGRTGRADILGVTTADNRAVGWVEGNLLANGYLWVGGNPVNRHTLRCTGVGSGDGISILWDFGQGQIVRGATCDWLAVGGDSPQPTAALVVNSPAGTVRQTFRLASFTAPRGDALDSAADRLRYRELFLGMLRSASGDAAPAAAWGGDLWETLTAVLEPYKGGPLLSDLFARAWPTVKALPDGQRHVLEDRFAETLRLLGNTTNQLDWIERLQKNERSRPRQFRWHEERIQCLLLDHGSVDAARRAAVAMREAAAAPAEIQRAVLRLGDVEYFAGNRAQAARHYADAQMRYRARNPIGGAVSGLSTLTPGGGPLRSLRESRQELKRSDAWKLYAVNDAAQSSTVRAYLGQGGVAEAFDALFKWENDTPMAKINGDFPMSEARVYFHVGDYRRAAAVLRPYLDGDIMTSQIPEALELRMEALMKLRRHAEVRPLARQALVRFEGLPAAARAAQILDQIGKE